MQGVDARVHLQQRLLRCRPGHLAAALWADLQAVVVRGKVPEVLLDVLAKQFVGHGRHLVREKDVVVDHAKELLLHQGL